MISSLCYLQSLNGKCSNFQLLSLTLEKRRKAHHHHHQQQQQQQKAKAMKEERQTRESGWVGRAGGLEVKKNNVGNRKKTTPHELNTKHHNSDSRNSSELDKKLTSISPFS